MKIGDKIKDLRKKHKLTQEDLAKKLDVRPTAVSAWERNANKPLMDKIVVMAEMWDVPVTYLLDVDDIGESSDMELLPVYGNISCGNGVLVYDAPESFEATPKDWLNGGEYFYMTAKGDSMIGARIHEGDLLLIRKQDEVENGEIAAVAVDDTAVLKRVFKQDDSVILQSENSKYPPISYIPGQNKRIKIIGKLKKVVLNF
ncbi:LexA family protein [Bacillus marasmi]|uniref:LexA family protein n=1 Tax=Bacillus marasmi TaxID=1926279 RepID=UPI0011CCC100|nr:XRE family transcriptional regulator [Bacillus marasmi]